MFAAFVIGFDTRYRELAVDIFNLTSVILPLYMEGYMDTWTADLSCRR